MIRPSIALATSMMAFAGGCASSSPALEIRAASTGLTGEVTKGGLNYAASQMALGNVGLALEAYRAVARRDPESVGAQLGIAQSYERMGRSDLSRKHLESALAIAPGQVSVLRLLAATLERQGSASEAAAVHLEIASLIAGSGDQIAAPASAAAPISAAPSAPASTGTSGFHASMAAGSSITVDLSETAAADAAQLSAVRGNNITVALAPAIGTPVEPKTFKARLTRQSLREVALSTSREPAWSPVSRELPATSKRQPHPQRSALAQGEIRIMNAARVEGLAGRTRHYLMQKGWRGIAVSDAPTMRSRTLLIYPAGREATARRLAAQFKHTIAMQPGGTTVKLLLGRDAVMVLRERS